MKKIDYGDRAQAAPRTAKTMSSALVIALAADSAEVTARPITFDAEIRLPRRPIDWSLWNLFPGTLEIHDNGDPQQRKEQYVIFPLRQNESVGGEGDEAAGQRPGYGADSDMSERKLRRPYQIGSTTSPAKNTKPGTPVSRRSDRT